MAADVPAYTEETWVEGAAPGIAAAQLQRIDDQIRALTDQFNLHNGGDSINDHPVATPGVLGMMSAGDKAKADGIEVAATQDQTDVEIRAAILATDGPGSGINADLLDNFHVHDIAPQIIEMNALTQSGTVAIGTGLTSHHSFTFIKPSGWNTFNILVIGSAFYTNGSGSAVLTANLDIGGLNSAVNTGPCDSAAASTTLVCARLIGATGDLAVKMETIRVGGTQADAKSTSYQIIAIRKT